MLRTKIIVHSSTTPEEVLCALPSDFEGHVTFDVGDRIQVCMIHHKKYIKPKQIYENLGIELHGYIPRFLYRTEPSSSSGRGKPLQPRYYSYYNYCVVVVYPYKVRNLGSAKN